MADQKGTGKHPRKSTEEPWEHHEGQSSGGQGVARAKETSGSQKKQSANSTEESRDLKEREYRDEKGEIHHHTHTFMEQHKKEESKKK